MPSKRANKKEAIRRPPPSPPKPAKKASTKKAAHKKPLLKKASKKIASQKPINRANTGFMAPLTPSANLAQILGNKPMPRTEVVKKLWDYIKKNKLQDIQNRRMINADAKLKPIFGKNQISMFELAKVVNRHVKK